MRGGAHVEVQGRAQKLRDDDRAKVGRKGFAEDSSVLDTSNAIFSARLVCRSADGDTHKSGRTASCYYELFLTASGMAYTRSGKIREEDAEDGTGRPRLVDSGGVVNCYGQGYVGSEAEQHGIATLRQKMVRKVRSGYRCVDGGA